tara:strand:+ start:486 stop:776 length:291 start_codon:yes stop_codon:yes gene_type:complete
VQPILLKEFSIISAFIKATSDGVPGSKASLLKNRFPASTTNVLLLNSDALYSDSIVALRARPPLGFFFQPQGSVSPLTLAVAIILIISFPLIFSSV